MAMGLLGLQKSVGVGEKNSGVCFIQVGIVLLHAGYVCIAMSYAGWRWGGCHLLKSDLIAIR